MSTGSQKKVEVLASVMHQTDHGILDRMRIATDAVFVNQCDHFGFEAFTYKGRNIRFYSMNERGVGLSRNTALMRAKGDILLFADDDVEYADGYEQIILNEYASHPEADFIVFDVRSENEDRPVARVSKFHRLRSFYCFRYGPCHLTIRSEAALRSHIAFSLLYGGGARYGCGEDSLFIFDCVKKLRGYVSPLCIGCVKQESSTWFHGYTDQYFMDRGAQFAGISPWLQYPLALNFAFRRRALFKGQYTPFEAYRLIREGMRKFKSEFGSKR